jgi:hypothetical protein
MSASNCDGDQLPFSLRLFPFYVTPKQHLARKREVQQGKVRPSTLNPLHPEAHLEHHRKRGPVIYPTQTMNAWQWKSKKSLGGESIPIIFASRYFYASGLKPSDPILRQALPLLNPQL